MTLLYLPAGPLPPLPACLSIFEELYPRLILFFMWIKCQLATPARYVKAIDLFNVIGWMYLGRCVKCSKALENCSVQGSS